VYSKKSEAHAAGNEYMKSGKLDFYGSAETKARAPKKPATRGTSNGKMITR
jgi:hypothetical protein